MSMIHHAFLFYKTYLVFVH